MKRRDLPVESPCSADWSTMTREGQKRFCASCKKHVHDLSSMTPAEARKTLDDKAEGLCVRYLYDDEGNILFMPSYDLVAPSILTRARRFVTAAGVLVAPLTLNACMGAAMKEPMPPQAPPVETATTIPDATPVDAGTNEATSAVVPVTPTPAVKDDAKSEK